MAIAYDPAAGGFDPTMLLQMFSGWLAPQLGGVAGQFNPTQSLHETLRQQKQMQEAAAAMQGAAAADARNIERAVRGFGAMSGFGTSKDWDRFAQFAGRDAAAGMPLFGQFINPSTPMGNALLGLAFGSRGSAMLGAKELLGAGSNMYDPSGAMGLSGATAGAMMNQVASDLYGSGNSTMRGLPIHEAMGYFSMMQKQGAGLRTVSGLMSSAEISALNAAKANGPVDVAAFLGSDRASRLSAAELQTLQSGDTAAGLEKIDGSRLSEFLKNNAGMMRAMKDVFGPNTPWAEAMQAAKDLTQGNVQGFGAQEMENFLRTSKELASSSRMGMEGLRELGGFLGSYAQSMGMSRRGTAQATQSAAAYRTAAEVLQLASAAPQLDIDKLAVQHGQLQMQAGNSAVAQQLGATLNVASMVGGFKQGSEAQQLVDAIKSGQKTYGNGKSVYMSEAEWNRIMVAGGADGSLIRDIRGMTGANRSAAIDAGADSLVRGMQFDIDTKPQLTSQMASSLMRSSLGINGNRAMDVSNAAIDAIMNMDMADYADVNKRKAAIEKALAGSGLSAEQAKQVAGYASMHFEGFAADRGWGDGAGLKAAHDPRMLKESAKAKGRADAAGKHQGKMAGIGQSNVWERISNVIQNATPGTSFLDIGMEILNIIGKDKLPEEPVEETSSRDPSLVKGLEDFHKLFGRKGANKDLAKLLPDRIVEAFDRDGKSLIKLLPAISNPIAALDGLGGDSLVKLLGSNKDSKLAPQGATLKIEGTLKLGDIDVPVSGTGVWA